MSDTKRRRWLYIDPSRSKKRERAKVKTSASFSHIYTIAENVPNEMNKQVRDLGSSQCSDKTTGQNGVSYRSQRAMNHSNSFHGNRDISCETHLEKKYSDQTVVLKNTTSNGHLKSEQKQDRTIIQKKNNNSIVSLKQDSESCSKGPSHQVLTRNESKQTSENGVGFRSEHLELKHSASYHNRQSLPTGNKQSNGGFTNMDRQVVSQRNTGVRKETSGVRDKIKLWNKREDHQQKDQVSSSDTMKHPLVIANHGALPLNGYCQKERETKSGFTDRGSQSTYDVKPSVAGNDCVTKADYCTISKGSSSASTGDYDELDNVLPERAVVVTGKTSCVNKTEANVPGRQNNTASTVDSDSDGEQASSEYVEYFVHCNGTVIKQKNANKDPSKLEKSSSLSGPEEQLQQSEMDMVRGYSGHNYSGVGDTKPNSNHLKWLPPASDHRYRLSDCSPQLSSSTSDMLQKLDHRPELDTLSVRENPERTSKSRKLKSLFKSHSKEPGRLNKHISWGTINEHFDDYPISKEKVQNKDQSLDLDDEVFMSTSYPKKSMSMNLTPGFLEDKSMVNTHYNLESPNSIGSASSLINSEDELSSCLDTLSNRSLDSDQQDSVLDTLSNNSLCSDQLDSSGCFTSSSLSQFSDYAEVTTKQRTRCSSLDPRQTKSNLDLVEIMSTFSDILDVSLESLQSQKLQSDKHCAQWDSQSHTGLLGQPSERRRLTPAMSFGCEMELQKQYSMFNKQPTDAHSINLDYRSHHNKWNENKSTINSSEIDEFSEECDSILGVSGFQRSDSTETITEEMVSELQSDSEQLQNTVQEIEKLSSVNSLQSQQLHAKQVLQHSRSDSGDFKYATKTGSSVHCNSDLDGNTPGLVKKLSPVTSRSCYELCQGVELTNTSNGQSLSSERTCDGVNKWAMRNSLTPEGTQGSKTLHSLSVNDRLSPPVPVKPSVYRKPRLIHSTSHASGLSKDPLGDWSSLQEALSELDPHFNLSTQKAGPHDSVNSSDPLKTRTLSVDRDTQKRTEVVNRTVTGLHERLNNVPVKETLKADHYPSVRSANALNNFEESKEGTKYTSNASVVSTKFAETDNHASESRMDNVNKIAVANQGANHAVILKVESWQIRHGNIPANFTCSDHNVAIRPDTDRFVPKPTDTSHLHQISKTSTGSYSSEDTPFAVNVKHTLSSPDIPTKSEATHNNVENDNTSSVKLKDDTVNSKLSNSNPSKTRGTGVTSESSKAQTSSSIGSESDTMSLATLLRMRSKSLPSRNTSTQNGIRRFHLSDISETTESQADFVNGAKVAMTTTPMVQSAPEVMSPEEQEELDLLLQSLDYDPCKE